MSPSTLRTPVSEVHKELRRKAGGEFRGYVQCDNSQLLEFCLTLFCLNHGNRCLTMYYLALVSSSILRVILISVCKYIYVCVFQYKIYKIQLNHHNFCIIIALFSLGYIPKVLASTTDLFPCIF